MKNIINTFLLILGSYSISFSDFRVIDINGGTISSKNKTTVIILNEDVNIKLFRDSCRVNCRFWVKSTQRSETLSVAFPNSLTDWGYSDKKNFRGVEDFSCKVDGIAAQHFSIRDTSKAFGTFHDNLWFQFKAIISKDSIHTIECSYRDKWYNRYSYLLGSAVTWNGPIQKGRIVFDHSSVCSRQFVYNPIFYNNSLYKELPLNLVPESFNDSIVYSFENHRPDSTEIVYFEIYQFWSYTTTPIYFDTVSITNEYNIIGSHYGFRNSFLYDFLSDTATFHHGYNFESIKNELINRTNCQLLKSNSNPLPFDSLSNREKITLSIMSGNLDSLKKEIIRTYFLRAKIVDISVSAHAECNKHDISKQVEDNLKNKVLKNNLLPQYLTNVYKESLNGKVCVSGDISEITGDKKKYGFIKNLTYTTTIKDTSCIPFILKEIQIQYGPACLGLGCNGHFSLEFKIITESIESKSSN